MTRKLPAAFAGVAITYGPALSHTSVKPASSNDKPDGWDITLAPSLAAVVISTRLAAKAAEPTGPLARLTVASQGSETFLESYPKATAPKSARGRTPPLYGASMIRSADDRFAWGAF